MSEEKFWLCVWTIIASVLIFLIYTVGRPDPAEVEASKRWTPQEFQCVYGAFGDSRDRARFCSELPQRSIEEIQRAAKD